MRAEKWGQREKRGKRVRRGGGGSARRALRHTGWERTGAGEKTVHKRTFAEVSDVLADLVEAVGELAREWEEVIGELAVEERHQGSVRGCVDRRKAEQLAER
jgi:hypothetical protein